jgi:hypothetical protein
MLQSKAGYIDARQHIRQLDESSLATRGRTIHLGQTWSFGDVGSMSGLPNSGHDWAIYEYTP